MDRSEVLGLAVDKALAGESLKDAAGVWRQLDQVILPPGENTKPLQTGSGNGFERDGFQERLKPLLLALRDHDIFPEDIEMTIGTNNPNMMRHESYIVLWIPRISRTIMVCNELGEATFAFRGYVSELQHCQSDKEVLVDKLGGKKIIYREGQWVADVLDVILRDWEDPEKKQLVCPKVDVVSAAELRAEILQEFPAPEDWMSLPWKEKADLKLHGKGLLTLASQLGLPGLKPVGLGQDMAKLGRAVYGEGHEVIECELWDKEQWIETIKEAYPTAEKWMSLPQKEKLDLRLHGKGLSALGGQLGLPGLNPVGLGQDMAKLGRAVYGEGHEVIECELWDKEQWIETIKEAYPTAEKWMSLPQKEKLDLRLHGKGLSALGGQLGLPGLNPVGLGQDMAKLGRAVYGEGHEVIECELWDKEQWIETIKEAYPTAEKWMSLPQKEKLDLRLHGKGLSALGGQLGLPGLNPVGLGQDMAKLGRVVYGEGHEVIECALNS